MRESSWHSPSRELERSARDIAFGNNWRGPLFLSYVVLDQEEPCLHYLLLLLLDHDADAQPRKRSEL